MGRMTLSGMTQADTDEDNMPDSWEDANIVAPLDKAAIDADDGVPGNLTRLFVRIGVSS